MKARARRQKSGVVAGVLLPLGLVCLFAFCSLALAVFGGQAYKSIQAGVDDSFGSTVAASYLRTKLSGAAGGVSLRTQDGHEVLVIAQDEGGVAYETRIFFADGRLVEVFERADAPLEVSSGIQIARLSSCSFSLQDGLFEAELTSGAGTVTRTACAVVQTTGGAV